MDCSEFRGHLDAWIDGELSAELCARMDAHAAGCEACRKERMAAEQLRDFLSHMDDAVAVPLPAQAGWRNVVRVEAKRRRMKRIYAAVGAVAAVCVLTLSVPAMLADTQYGSTADAGSTMMVRSVDAVPKAFVESDGVSADAALEASAAPESGAAVVSYAELKVVAEDAQTACGYVRDIVAEYGGQVDREAEDTGGRKLYVLVPGENAADFVSAVGHVGLEADGPAADMDCSAGLVGVCVVIYAN